MHKKLPKEVSPPVRSRRRELFQVLPPAEVVSAAVGRIFYDVDRPAKDVYLLREGRVKVSAVEGDRTVTLRILGADEFFGEECLPTTPLEGVARKATALDPVKYHKWPADVVRNHVVKYPEWGFWFLEAIIASTLKYDHHALSLAGKKDARERIERLLVDMAKESSMPAEDGSMFVKHLTHENISERLGLTRESVTLTLRKIQAQRRIKYSRAGFWIKPELLRSYGD